MWIMQVLEQIDGLGCWLDDIDVIQLVKLLGMWQNDVDDVTWLGNGMWV